MFSLRRWRPTHLLAAWITWWVGLLAVSMRYIIVTGIRVANEGGSAHGGMGSDGIGATIVTKAGETFTVQYSAATVVAWVVGPPLLLWAAWLAKRPSRPSAVPELREGWPDASVRQAPAVSTPVTPVGGVER